MVKEIQEKIRVYLERSGGIGTTTQILENIYGRAKEINEILKKGFISEERKKELKREKEKLERKLLYHLKKLEKTGDIKVIGRRDTGEKIFELNKKYKREIDPEVELGIKKYEERGLVHIFSKEWWNKKFNSVIIDGKHIEKPYAETIIKLLIKNVNDCVGIINSNYIFNDMKLNEINQFLNSLAKECESYGRKISFCLNLNDMEFNKLKIIAEKMAELDNNYIEFIFELEKNEIIENKAFIKKWIELNTNRAPRLNLYFPEKGKKVLIGRAGVYSYAYFDCNIDVVGIISVMLDVFKIMKSKGCYKLFREIIKDISMSFSKIVPKLDILWNKYINIPILERFMEKNNVMKNSGFYIRFWNYNWETLEKDYFLELIKASISYVREFESDQNYIFKNAGIPFKLNIKFNSAFSTFCKGKSKRCYRKRSIYGIKDLLKEDMIRFFDIRNELSKIYENIDRVRIFRGGKIKGDDVVREINYIINTTNIKLLSLDLEPRSGYKTLEHFM